jgi:uncharacterized membrane protein
MGWVVLVLGLLFLVAGLVISLWQAFRNFAQQVDDICGDRMAAEAYGLAKLARAIAKLLQAFAKLTVGIQLSVIGLVLVYCGMRILEILRPI